MNRKIPLAQKRALVWLHQHGGDGVFQKRGQTLLAQGDFGPFARKTWNALRDRGWLAFYDEKRCRLTPEGMAEAAWLEPSIGIVEDWRS